MVRIGRVQKIIIAALIIRVFALFVVFTITPDWSSGLISDSIKQDDVRYEMGAIRYAETAQSIFDYDAFSSAYSLYGDYVGTVENIFLATPLWYWIVCIAYYLTKSIVAIRLCNIVFSVISILFLYKLVRIYYKESVAITASKLLAFLPYPIIFSCFSYKDNLVMMLTIYLLYRVLNYRVTKEISIKIIVKIALAALALFLIRGGLSTILIVFCFMIAFWTKEKIKGKKKAIQYVGLMLITTGIAIFIILNSMEIINDKMYAYLMGRDVLSQEGIAFVTISNITELYKLPLTFLFAIVMPIGFSGALTSWSDIISILNICMAPIAVGAAIDIFLHKKNEWMFLGCCLAYYSISIIASIGIFRHYFSLLFIPIILFSHFKWYGEGNVKSLWRIGSMLYGSVLVIWLIF